MASGNILNAWGSQDGRPPGTLAAAFSILVGGSTPAESVPCVDFDGAGAVEYMDYYGVLPPHYAGGGLTLTLIWAAAANTNNVIWQAAIRRRADDAEDLDTSQTYDYNASAAATAPSAIGEESYDNITFTSGADMDLLAAGEAFILRIKRDSTHASDTMTSDARLTELVLKET